MKIAILTLPLHTNYGGILQAYALQTVLQCMGHDVEVLDTDITMHHPGWMMPMVYSKRMVMKLLRCSSAPIFYERRQRRENTILQKHTQVFIKKNIVTRNIARLSEITPDDYDCIITGSDQIWRKPYFTWMWHSSVPDAFLRFTDGWNRLRRVAYAASFGVDNLNEYTPGEIEECARAIRTFDAVTVRETDGIGICRDNFGVEASAVVDPTMLLAREDYVNLIKNAGVNKSRGDMLCYVLDPDEYKQKIINHIADAKNLTPFNVNAPVDDLSLPVTERIQPPVEEWLQGFNDAKFIVTDSFHACVFSIIFGKPFLAIANAGRGVSRFTSLLSRFGLLDRLITADSQSRACDVASTDIDWGKVHDILEHSRSEAIQYLSNATK